ncbi:hypothetical protein IKQ65_02215 [Candidatus Saccharibacteria bacterium]|nr:hypothetical protein [Candidatus Saccharibacteria bacterium]
MSRELHHRKSDDSYALWSTVIDDYVTEWKSKREIRDEWLAEFIIEDIAKVDKYMEQIDKEVE